MERKRLVDAFTKVAAERGYAATGVEEVAAAAGVPRSIFDKHFNSKRQCLLAAHDNFFDRLIGEVEFAMDPDAPWPQQVRAGVEAAIGFMIESAAAARLFVVEAPTVGPQAIDRYIAAIERIVLLLRLGRQRLAGAEVLPALTESVLVAGAASVVTGALLAEEQESLPELVPQLVDVLLLPYVGAGGTQPLPA